MAVTPIKARCRGCRRVMYLNEVAANEAGHCRQCGCAISPDRAHELREQSAIAERSLRQLVSSLQRLRRLPGNLELIASSVLENVIGEVGWEPVPGDTPELTSNEVTKLKRRARRLDKRQAKERSRPQWITTIPIQPWTTAPKEESSTDVAPRYNDLSRV